MCGNVVAMIMRFFRLHDVDRSESAYGKKTKRRSSSSSEEESSTTTSNGSDSRVGGRSETAPAACGDGTASGCRRRWGRAPTPPPPPPPDIGLAIRQAVSVVAKVRAASAVSPTTYEMISSGKNPKEEIQKKEEEMKHKDVPDKYITKAVEDLPRPRQHDAAGGEIPTCGTHLHSIDESESEEHEE
jgi:hypothetical protein